ncbi:LTA synthase family protein [Deltaproteobacteria bacterium OttesenSCG-928-M10]|nr:LTA synthase family protein [Deltaproteobacteria bacterium OttesenSCG-928-M10]
MNKILKHHKLKKFGHLLLSTMLFSSLLFFATFFWLEAFFGRQFDVEAVIFTLIMPLEGADKTALYEYMKLAAIAVPLFLFVSWAYYRLLSICSLMLPSTSSGQSNPAAEELNQQPARQILLIKRPRFLYAALIVLAIMSFLGALLYLEDQKRVLTFIFGPMEQTPLFVDYYQKLDAEQVSFEIKRNVVIIILESIENTFYDERRFGESLLPNLEKIREENLSFDGFRDTRGATWTFSALASFFNGLPIAFSKGVSDTIKKKNLTAFLPNASSILEIFENHGYNMSLILGSDVTFSDKKLLFTTHASPKILDYSYFQSSDSKGKDGFPINVGKWEPTNGDWGVPDPVIYAEAKKYLESYDSSQPFLLILETVDTHLPKGHFNGLVPAKWGDMRDCLVEADLLAYDFITWLQSQSFAPSTTIIVLGDHLYPKFNLGGIKMPPAENRQPYNVFINPAIKMDSLKPNRNFAAFDLAPTILESAGARLPEGGFGLGRSLFRPDLKTIFELRGKEWYEEEVRKRSPFYESLHGYQASDDWVVKDGKSTN